MDIKNAKNPSSIKIDAIFYAPNNKGAINKNSTAKVSQKVVTDSVVTDSLNENKGETSIQESFLSDNPITHKVITTPNKNESARAKHWYRKPLFIYLIWPIVTGLIVWLISTLV